jgi:glyoxylase-like metal-dependent hydrolase (beta-lactamase superfamily II)
MPILTPFNLGLLPADLTQWFALPEGHPYAGRVENLPIYFYLIRLRGRLILVDAPSYEFPGDDSMLLPEYKGRTAAMLLTQAGVPPASIDHVIITHPHLDHTLGLSIPANEPTTAVFPNAHYYIGAKDWQNLPNMEEVEQAPLKVIERTGRLILVEDELDLGDGLSIMPAPGETPGHQIVRIQSQAGEIYIVGDLYHHILEFAEADRHPIWSDGPTLGTSKATFEQQIAGKKANVFFTHIEGAYRVEVSGQTLKWVKFEPVNM